MKSGALQELGEEKLSTIINRLVSGENTMTVARIIQEEWGEAQDLSRGALEKELTRLRMTIDRGGLSSDLAEPSLSTSADDLEPLHELASLLAFQKRRIGELSMREREQGKPLPALTLAIKTYADTLSVFQAMRFDLGHDVYKRVKLTSRELLDALDAEKHLIHNQIIEAVGIMDEIFKKRRIRVGETKPQN